ncbi:ORF22 [Ranid herpesvirus 2]|uniref:ORF22 n=1 Tax=Ranid herpesvirus 2 TaxID=389214 RepID=Q14W84_9VIRU|nr:ORF22 [Ranid herpesvirus 2]ABG25681.1 ORF22 [Ranid herpesvirus 2]
MAHVEEPFMFVGNDTKLRVFSEFKNAIKTQFDKYRDWPNFMRAVILHEFTRRRLRLGEFDWEYRGHVARCREKGLEVTDEVSLEAFIGYVVKHYSHGDVYFLNELLKYGMELYRFYSAEPLVLFAYRFSHYTVYHYRDFSGREDSCDASLVCVADRPIPQHIRSEIEGWKRRQRHQDSFYFGNLKTSLWE